MPDTVSYSLVVPRIPGTRFQEFSFLGLEEYGFLKMCPPYCEQNKMILS